MKNNKVHRIYIVILVLVSISSNLFAQLKQVDAIDEKYEVYSECVGQLLTKSDQVKETAGQIAEIDYLRSNLNNCGKTSVITRRFALRLLEFGDTSYDDKGVEPEQDKRAIFEEALAWSHVALEQDTSQHLNHEQMSMAYAAMISVSRLRGKAILADSVRIYAENAVRLNPQNDRAYHILGRWHFEVSQLSWFLRKLSKLVFNTSPEGSFELAINYFNKALELDNIPVHRFWLGRAYLESGNKEEALYHFKQVLELQNVQHNDDYFKREAQRLIEENE